jgi:hypothetical protein
MIFPCPENPLVCVERIHMLQQGSGVFIPNSDDAVCGPKAETDAPATVAAPGGSLSAGIHVSQCNIYYFKNNIKTWKRSNSRIIILLIIIY